jgi:ATP-dependent helicase HrpB
MNRLPIEDVLPVLRDTLTQGSNAVLSAPPGAGKTTRVPLALLNAPWLTGKTILMLEPRRLAARAAAHRMASVLGESIGSTVGYRMRLDSKIGPVTRIEVVTEGILTRLLLDQPELDRYGAILFDEFHERSLQADVGLALCLETQRLVRPDLRLLVMSATLDCGPVSELLGEAPIIISEGRMFAVETRYLTRPHTGPLEAAVIQAIRRSLTHDQGSVLVFLPGMAEIRRVERQLLDSNPGPGVVIAPLHGDLPQSAQDKAIVPAEPGTRKVVLATSIAETSLTIDGVQPSFGIDAVGDGPRDAGFGRPAQRQGRPAGVGHLLSPVDGTRTPVTGTTKNSRYLGGRSRSDGPGPRSMGRDRPFPLTLAHPASFRCGRTSAGLVDSSGRTGHQWPTDASW